jgi:hypothetical protein
VFLILEKLLGVKHLIQSVPQVRKRFFLFPLVFMEQFQLDIHGMKSLLVFFREAGADNFLLIQLLFFGDDTIFALLQEGLPLEIFLSVLLDKSQGLLVVADLLMKLPP